MTREKRRFIMKNKMIKISTKISTAMVVAASVMTMASITAFAADDTVIADETVAIEEVAATEEAPECEMTVPETEGQGDIIDDEFAVNEVDAWIASCKDRPTGVTQYVRPVVAPVVIAEEANGSEEAEEVEGQGDVIDDEFAVDAEVEGQGDVIDDEFAYVEGQGDVIDDEFAVSEEEAWEAANEIRSAEMAKYFGEFGTVEMDLHNAEWYQEYQKAQEVEGQGDVIDDEFAVDTEVESQEDVIDVEFAVVPEECEYVTDDQLVVDNSCMGTASFVAVGSADFAEGHIFEPTDIDEDIKKAYEDMYLKEDEKSWFTKKIEFVNKLVDPSNFISDEICKTIDESESVGAAEKVLGKELVRNGLSTVFGAPVPEAGTPKKMLKAVESFSRGVDAPTTAGKVLNAIDGVKNCVEAGFCLIPGGGLVVSGVEAGVSVIKYGATKLLSWLW